MSISDTPLPNPFRNSTGSRYLKALFFEEASDRSTAIYTLKDKDHQGLPSLYRLYMATNDPTEWRFATSYLDGWEHWEMLCECTWFAPTVTRWRKEMRLRLSSESLARIMAEAKTNSKESFVANKYLLEEGWKPRIERKNGRPSKESIRSAAHEIASESTQINSDFKRLMNPEGKFYGQAN